MSATTRSGPNTKTRGPDPALPWGPALIAPMANQALQMTVASVELLQVNLRMWRGVADTMRESIRHQQDAAVRTLQAQAASVLKPAKGADAETARTFLSPLFDVQRTYEQMGAAMLEAQREAMARLSDDDRPH